MTNSERCRMSNNLPSKTSGEIWKYIEKNGFDNFGDKRWLPVDEVEKAFDRIKEWVEDCQETYDMGKSWVIPLKSDDKGWGLFDKLEEEKKRLGLQ